MCHQRYELLNLAACARRVVTWHVSHRRRSDDFMRHFSWEHGCNDFWNKCS